MRTDRLTRLADYLENEVAKMPPERWDMWAWGEERECGTVGCAMGHACSIPEFREAGLRLYHGIPLFGFPSRSGVDAAVELFDISASAANHIFIPSKYPHPHAVTIPEVVARIRALVEGKS